MREQFRFQSARPSYRRGGLTFPVAREWSEAVEGSALTRDAWLYLAGDPLITIEGRRDSEAPWEPMPAQMRADIAGVPYAAPEASEVLVVDDAGDALRAATNKVTDLQKLLADMVERTDGLIAANGALVTERDGLALANADLVKERDALLAQLNSPPSLSTSPGGDTATGGGEGADPPPAADGVQAADPPSAPASVTPAKAGKEASGKPKAAR
jgi:hypothetical protein